MAKMHSNCKKSHLKPEYGPLIALAMTLQLIASKFYEVAMSRTKATVSRDHQPVAEARLWQAVILNTVQDWISGPLRIKREAEEYLFREDSDLALVCQSAGMDMGRLRRRLSELRSRKLSGDCPTTA